MSNSKVNNRFYYLSDYELIEHINGWYSGLLDRKTIFALAYNRFVSAVTNPKTIAFSSKYNRAAIKDAVNEKRAAKEALIKLM